MQVGEYYKRDDEYNALIAALTDLQPCPMEGRITPDQYKLVLGEVGGIWPQAILRDVILTATREAERAFEKSSKSSIPDAIFLPARGSDDDEDND